MSVRFPPLATAGLAALAAVNLWLLTIVVGDVAGNDPAPVAAPAWNPKLPDAAEDSPVARPIQAYRETLVRPVFFKTREPYVPPPPRPIAAPAPAALPKPPPAVVDPGLIVGGVIISRDVRKAYVYGKTDSHGHGTWVSEGEVLTGWKVVAIDSGGVKLQQQDRTIELHLYPPR
jgi:hypothetical protein